MQFTALDPLYRGTTSADPFSQLRLRQAAFSQYQANLIFGEMLALRLFSVIQGIWLLAMPDIPRVGAVRAHHAPSYAVCRF